MGFCLRSHYYALLIGCAAITLSSCHGVGIRSVLNSPAASTDTTTTTTTTPAIKFSMDFTLGSVQPQLGTQSFTFTRADTGLAATHFGSDGLLRNAPHNLILRSQEWDDAAWYSSNSTITANSTTAPDGTLTAETLNEDATNNDHTRRQDIVKAATSLVYTYSVYVKAGSRHFVELRTESGGGGVFARFDLSTGQYLNNVSYGAGFTFITASIQAVGNGWYRLSSTSLTDTVPGYSSGVRVLVGPCTGTTTGSYMGDGSASVYVWGAQIEQNRGPSTYLATTATTRFDGPRYDYDPIAKTPRGLRLEEDSTNLLPYSQQFDQSGPWSAVNSSIVANTMATTDPMGSNNAEVLVEDSTTDYHYVSQTISKSAASLKYVGSVFLKASSRSDFWMQLSSPGAAGGVDATFDLTGVTVAGSATWGTGWTLDGTKIESIGNGWYRATIMATSDSDTSLEFYVGLAQGTNTMYLGNGAGHAYIFGAQVEQPDQTLGSSQISGTYYIPTGATSVTRAQEYLESTGGLGSWYNTIGTWFTDWRMNSTAETGANSTTLLRLHDETGISGPDYRISVKSGTHAQFEKYNGSRSQFSVFNQGTEGGFLGVSDFKAAFTIKSGDTVARVNGIGGHSLVTADSFIATPTAISIGTNFSGNILEPFTGWIKEISFYDARVTDANLNSMTSTTAPNGFIDLFDDNSMSSKWVAATTYAWWASGPVTANETATQLQVNLTGTSGANGYITADTYQMEDAYAMVELIQEMGSSSGCTSTANQGGIDIELGTGVSGENTLQFYVEKNNSTGIADLVVNYNANGSATEAQRISYSSSMHRFLRIRHDGIASFVFETSPDGWTWTNRQTLAQSIFTSSTGNLAARIALFGSGTCTVATDVGPVVFDQFRTNAIKN